MIDPSKILAILIGIDSYEAQDLHDLPAALDNVTNLRNALKRIGIPSRNIKSIVSIDKRDGLLQKVNKATAENDYDSILIYYAGHGLMDSNYENFYLSVGETNVDDLPFTALSVASLSDRLGKTDKKKIFIFDCCFSENAFSKIDQRNYLAISSSARNKTSKYPEDEDHSAFTQELINVLEHGIELEKELLCFSDVFQEIKNRLSEKKLPIPHEADINRVGKYNFIKNLKFHSHYRIHGAHQGSLEKIDELNQKDYSLERKPIILKIAPGIHKECDRKDEFEDLLSILDIENSSKNVVVLYGNPDSKPFFLVNRFVQYMGGKNQILFPNDRLQDPANSRIILSTKGQYNSSSFYRKISEYFDLDESANPEKKKILSKATGCNGIVTVVELDLKGGCQKMLDKFLTWHFEEFWEGEIQGCKKYLFIIVTLPLEYKFWRKRGIKRLTNTLQEAINKRLRELEIAQRHINLELIPREELIKFLGRKKWLTEEIEELIKNYLPPQLTMKDIERFFQKHIEILAKTHKR